jgi:RHS repeat-associated protein
VSHSYDDEGRLLESTVLGHVIRYSYTTHGRVTITDAATRTHTLEHDEFGLMLRRHPGGVGELAQWNSDGLLEARATWHEDERMRVTTWRTQYRWSNEGRLQAAFDSDVGRVRYDRDATGVLLGEQWDAGRIVLHLRDAAGNLQVRPDVRYVQYGAGNTLLQADEERFTYDVCGAMNTRTVRGKVAVQYHHDALGRLRTVEFGDGRDPWTGYYDALGRLIAWNQGPQYHLYVWDHNRLAAERWSDGRERIYVYAGVDALVPVAFTDFGHAGDVDGNGETFVVFSDAMGHPRRIVDCNGRTVWNARMHEAYGTLTVDDQPELDFAPRWPGHLWVTALSLQYNRHRWYDPRLGRYLESDPLGTAGGVNLYAYVADPTSGVDLCGLSHKDKPDANTASEDADGDLRRARRENVAHALEDDAPTVSVEPNRSQYDPTLILFERRGLSPEEAAVAMDRAIREAVRRAAQRESSAVAAHEALKSERRQLVKEHDRLMATQRETRDAHRAAKERKKNATGNDRLAATEDVEAARIAHNRATSDAEAAQRNLNENAEEMNLTRSLADRVFEAAYDPHSGCLIVHVSGAPVPEGGHPNTQLCSKIKRDTTPGMCGMTHAQGAIQERRSSEHRNLPIYTSNGGYSFHTDAPTNVHPLQFSHRTACFHCQAIYGLNPHIVPVGNHPQRVRDNPEAHPVGRTTPLGEDNVPTPLEDLD